MKHATLSIAILFLLSGPAAVLAETPAVPVNPLDTGAAKAAVEAAVQPVIEALPTAATAAGTAVVEAQPKPVDAAPAAVAESAAKTAVPAVTETPAADVVELDVIPLETAAATPAADTTSTGDSMNPCPKYGMGKNRMGMGGDGSGMRGMKQGAGCKGKCKCKGKGKRKEMSKKHAEVVQRLDMIEARMAKIEAMLESLMKRADD
jgi:hypothetical protein